MIEQTPEPTFELPSEQLEVVGQARPITFEPPDPLPEPLPAHPRRPRVWSVFVVLVLAFLANGIGGLIYLHVAGLLHSSSDTLLSKVAETPGAIVGMSFWSMSGMAAVALLAALASPVPLRQRLRLVAPSISAGQMISAAVGVTSVGMIYVMLDALGFVPRSETLEAFGKGVSGLHGGEVWLAAFVIGLSPGIAEELLCRGYIQTRLTQRWGVCVSVFITALLFGAYHLDLPQGAFAFVIGLLLGALAERAKSIVPGMIAHTANNVFAVLVGVSGLELGSELECWVLLAVFAALLVVCMWYALRRGAPVPAEVEHIVGTAGGAESQAQEGVFDPSQDGGSP